MRDIIPLRKPVQFYSFARKENQGFTVNLGVHDVFINRVATPSFNRNGCCSRELVTEIVLTVTLSGRTFEVRLQYQTYGDYECWLPHGFNPFEAKAIPAFRPISIAQEQVESTVREMVKPEALR